MWRWSNRLRPQAEFLALEASVARAGLALVCSYSSSDEYEAAAIAAWRAAMTAHIRRRTWFAGITAALVVGLAVVV
jgi:hypothetical protein